MRITKHRQEILDTLSESRDTLSASDIHSNLPHINLVTIYRNLERFVSEGLIKKLHLDNQETLYENKSEPHHHAICNDCERVIHFSLKDKKIINKIQIPNFTIDNIDIIVRGSCNKLHQNQGTESQKEK